MVASNGRFMLLGFCELMSCLHRSRYKQPYVPRTAPCTLSLAASPRLQSQPHPALGQPKSFVPRLQSCQPHLLKEGTVRIVAGNALGDLLQDENAPFDAIHVGAAAASMPETLLTKLAPGGRMVRLRARVRVKGHTHGHAQLSAPGRHWA